MQQPEAKTPRSKAMDSHDRLHLDLGALSQRVLSHEQSLAEFKTSTAAALQSISSQLNQLGSSMESRMRPQWGTMATLAGLMLSFFIVFVVTPIQRDIEGLRGASTYEARERVTDIKELRDNTVSWREHSQLLTDLREARSQQVTRAEHEQHWMADKAQTLYLQEQIKRLNDQLSGLYNGGDLLRELQQRIHDLEGRSAPRS